MPTPHPFHEALGNSLKEKLPADYKLIRDRACGGNQHIPLFCPGEKGRETQYCNVDMLIMRGDKVSVLIEIEESDIKPTQVCGKFFTSALSACFTHRAHGKDPIPMANSVLFIQVLDTSKLKTDRTKKLKQFENLQLSIQRVIPIKGSYIKEYRLVKGGLVSLERVARELVEEIHGFFA